jgi:membrane protease YdiL (CAAX protease family)
MSDTVMFSSVLTSSLVILTIVVIQTSRIFSGQILTQRFLSGVALTGPTLANWGSADYLRLYRETAAVLPLVLIVAVVVVIATAVSARSEQHWKFYPLYRPRVWNLKHTLLNGISWSFYLVTYELLFRGYLFFSLTPGQNFVFAVMVNVFLYAVAHIHKGLKELLLSVPFGVVMCYLVVRTGNVWPAVVCHILLALSNDYFSYRASRAYHNYQTLQPWKP